MASNATKASGHEGHEGHGGHEGRGGHEGKARGDAKSDNANPQSAASKGQVKSAARHAADKATARNSTTIPLGHGAAIRLPSPDELAYVAGLGVLAALEIIEWPVAVVLGAGHVLVSGHRNKALRDFGEALEEGV